MDSLVYEIDKGLAREFIKAHELEKGMAHYDLYTNFLKTQIESGERKEFFEEKLFDCIKEYNDVLFTEARNAFNSEKWLKTTQICRKLIENDFKEASVYKFLSFCYKNLNQNDIRLEFIKKYVELMPDDKENNKLLGEAYFEFDAKKYANKALKLFEKHLELNDKDDFVWNLLGHIYATHIYTDTKQIEKQLECFKKAHELAPQSSVPLKNMAQTFVRARMEKEATEIYQRLFSEFRDHLSNDDIFGYAAFLLRFGHYKEGFKQYECRINTDKKLPEDKGVFYPKIDKPRWDGRKNIKDSTLLVHFEQGLGDNIMFIRFVKNIKKYVKNVIAVVPDLVYPLFWESKLPFDIYPARHPLEKLDFDYHIPLLSLPLALGLTPDTITDRDGYLTVEPDRVVAYKKAFINDDGKFKIGINFEGGETGKAQARDIDWVHLREFAQIENVQLYCLNKNINEKYLKELIPEHDIVALGGTFQNFADTAAAMLNMDYIVSTDSGILNLAGALGLDTLGLFNFDYEYRWYKAETGSIGWYSKVKTIVNDFQNVWEPTIDKAVEHIKCVMSQR